MIYDAIVVGAGVNGSSAAYALSQRGKSVLLLEQFPLPHTRGSSHGQTRVFRCLYAKEIYAKMSFDSISLWRDMEKQLDETLLIQNGNLEIYNTSDRKTITSRKNILDNINVNYEFLSSQELNKRFKPFDLSEEHCGIYERLGGMVMANKCVAAFQKLFVRNGGVLHDNEQVLSVIGGEPLCTIVTNKQTYKTRSVVIAAGPFSKKLIDSTGLYLPLQVKRTHLCFWKLSDPTVATVSAGFPSFMHLPSKTYGTASMEYPGLLKFCYHGGTPVEMDYPDTPAIISGLIEIIENEMTGVSSKPSIVEGCLYTVTPDEDFIIDRHPKYKNIIIGAGFSGTGFKMAPATGQVLADLVLGKTPTYDISSLRIGRFANVVNAKALL